MVPSLQNICLRNISLHDPLPFKCNALYMLNIEDFIAIYQTCTEIVNFFSREEHVNSVFTRQINVQTSFFDETVNTYLLCNIMRTLCVNTDEDFKTFEVQQGFFEDFIIVIVSHRELSYCEISEIYWDHMRDN